MNDRKRAMSMCVVTGTLAAIVATCAVLLIVGVVRQHRERRYYAEAQGDLVVLRSACQNYLTSTGGLPRRMSDLSQVELQLADDYGSLGSMHMSFECLATTDDGKLLSGGVLVIMDPDIGFPILYIIDGSVGRVVGGGRLDD